jgi:putative heme-binding domain-containing protein
MQDIFVTMGRMFSNVAVLGKALKTADASAPTSPQETRRALTALVVGAAERSHERIDAAADDVWLNAIVIHAIECAQDTAAPASYRQLTIRLLACVPWSKAREPLSLLANADTDEALQAAAIRALASFPEPDVCRTLLTHGKWSTRTPAQREAILGALLANPVHFGGVLDAIEAGALPQNAIPTIRRPVFLKAKDTAIRTRAEKIFESAAGGQQAAFEKAKGALTLTGDAVHGREIFHNFCSSCHRLEQDGHAVGPDLFDIRNQPKENILFHIVAPDAEIAPTFTAYSVEMKDGRTFAGLLASETASSVRLRMPLAQEETLSRSYISKIEALPSSLMPSGLDAMGNQSLSDLLAFLKGEGKQ